jgi:hypothetical protein
MPCSPPWHGTSSPTPSAPWRGSPSRLTIAPVSWCCRATAACVATCPRCLRRSRFWPTTPASRSSTRSTACGKPRGSEPLRRIGFRPGSCRGRGARSSNQGPVRLTVAPTRCARWRVCATRCAGATCTSPRVSATPTRAPACSATRHGTPRARTRSDRSRCPRSPARSCSSSAASSTRPTSAPVKG